MLGHGNPRMAKFDVQDAVGRQTKFGANRPQMFVGLYSLDLLISSFGPPAKSP